MGRLESMKSKVDKIREDFNLPWKKKLFEKLGEGWVCVKNADYSSKELTINDCVNHGNFGFKWKKEGANLKTDTDQNIHLRVEFEIVKIFWLGYLYQMT